MTDPAKLSAPMHGADRTQRWGGDEFVALRDTLLAERGARQARWRAVSEPQQRL